LRVRQISRVRFGDKALFPSNGVDDFACETGTTDETGDGSPINAKTNGPYNEAGEPSRDGARDDFHCEEDGMDWRAAC